MQKNKKIIAGMAGLISLGFLTGCGKSQVGSDAVVQNVSDEKTDELNIVKNDKLAIDQDKCIGCGKCARVAPDNFEMNTEIRKAQVKSTEIINQAEVTRAVEGCPVVAISQ